MINQEKLVARYVQIVRRDKAQKKSIRDLQAALELYKAKNARLRYEVTHQAKVIQGASEQMANDRRRIAELVNLAKVAPNLVYLISFLLGAFTCYVLKP